MCLKILWFLSFYSFTRYFLIMIMDLLIITIEFLL